MRTVMTTDQNSFRKSDREEKIAFIRKNNAYYLWVNFVGFTDDEVERVREKTEMLVKAKSLE